MSVTAELKSLLQVMQKVERWIIEHRTDPRQSRLRRMVPSVGNFFTPIRCSIVYTSSAATALCDSFQDMPLNALEASCLGVYFLCRRGAQVASHLPRRLVEAFKEYDEFFALSRRQYVPPNFAEIRHILNIAQVRTNSTCFTKWHVLLIVYLATSCLHMHSARPNHRERKCCYGSSHHPAHAHHYTLCIIGPADADITQSKLVAVRDTVHP